MYYVGPGGAGPINAKTRFIYHYEKAVEEYLKGNYSTSNHTMDAWGHLGAAIHYMSDLATPVHTGDPQSVGNSGIYNMVNHHTFELTGLADTIA